MKRGILVSCAVCTFLSVLLLAVSYWCWYTTLDYDTANNIGEATLYITLLVSSITFQYIFWKQNEKKQQLLRTLGGGIATAFFYTIIYVGALYLLLEVIDPEHQEHLINKAGAVDLAAYKEQWAFFLEHYYELTAISVLMAGIILQVILSLLFTFFCTSPKPSNSTILDA